MARTYNELYLSARRELRQAGVEAYSLEARLLTAFAARRSPEKLLQSASFYADGDTEARLARLMQQRLAGEPVAYLTGQWEFYGLPMKVTPQVLIPRPDTEVLVETALALLGSGPESPRILDLCCGSGCIGCALAAGRPDARVTMLDISEDAVRVARENVQMNCLTPRVTCLTGDVLQPPPRLLGEFELVTCNPPYVATEELAALDISVRDYEPRLALDGGADGLDYYRRIIPLWKSVIRDRGWFIFEVGEEQAARVAGLLAANGFGRIQSVKDTAGTERVVLGSREQKQI